VNVLDYCSVHPLKQIAFSVNKKALQHTIGGRLNVCGSDTQYVSQYILMTTLKLRILTYKHDKK